MSNRFVDILRFLSNWQILMWIVFLILDRLTKHENFNHSYNVERHKKGSEW